MKRCTRNHPCGHSRIAMRPVIRKFLLIGIMTFSAILGGCQNKDSFPLFEESTAAELREVITEPTAILLTHSELENSLTHAMSIEFKHLLEEKSEGEFQVEVYPNNTLGNLSDGVNYFSNGAIEMRAGVGPSDIMHVLFWLPSFTEVNLNELEARLQPGSALRRLLDDECNSRNVKILGMLPPVFRIVSSKEKINTVEDLQGMRMRVISEGMEQQYWGALGMETYCFDVEQVYTALQQGIVDAQENTLLSIGSNRLYEQQSYLTFTNHKVYIDALYIDQSFYNGLTEEQQSMIDLAAAEAVSRTAAQMAKYLLNIYKQMEEETELVNLPDGERQKWREAVGPLVKEYLAGLCGEERLDAVRQALLEMP